MTEVIYEYEKYVTDSDNLKATLEEYGVAIIPSVLNDKECSNMINGMWDTLEHWTQLWPQEIDRNDKSSWRNMKDLFPKHSMLIQQWGLGHAQFIWNLRQNPKCVEIFAKLWNCEKEDLLVSFDGASFHMPPEITKIGWHRQTWLHTDQSYRRNNFECIQSWATAYDVNENDATLCVLEKSHSYHKEFAETFAVDSKDDWFKLNNEEYVEFYKSRGCEERYIKCPKGSMVFWDSRTIHCGVEPRKCREKPNFRCVVYLCYVPRFLTNEKQMKKKREAFDEMRMTSHWPHKIKLFPKMPRTYGAEVKPIVELEKPVLNELGRKLAGF